MIWTAITIDSALKTQHHVLTVLSHDGNKALEQAKRALPGVTIVALIKGNHGSSTYIPPSVK